MNKFLVLYYLVDKLWMWLEFITFRSDLLYYSFIVSFVHSFRVVLGSLALHYTLEPSFTSHPALHANLWPLHSVFGFAHIFPIILSALWFPTVSKHGKLNQSSWLVWCVSKACNRMNRGIRPPDFFSSKQLAHSLLTCPYTSYFYKLLLCVWPYTLVLTVRWDSFWHCGIYWLDVWTHLLIKSYSCNMRCDLKEKKFYTKI